MASCVTFEQRPAIAQQMAMVRNPFHVQLATEGQSLKGYEKAIPLEILCESAYSIRYYWGVGINDFHKWMNAGSDKMVEAISNGELFDRKYLYSGQSDMIVDEPKKEFSVPCPDEVNEETLGKSPRSIYPLVVILQLNADIEQCQDTDTIFNINVIHIKDNTCPMETSIISKLLKQKNGSVISIQNLFVPEADRSCAEEWTCCVICQEQVVSIALLPCRHACVCFECFSKIDKCPLCRSYISTYFELKSSPADQQSLPSASVQSNAGDKLPEANETLTESEPTTVRHSRTGLFSRINNRLNRWFH